MPTEATHKGVDNTMYCPYSTCRQMKLITEFLDLKWHNFKPML